MKETTEEIIANIAISFPNTVDQTVIHTSDENSLYNCIAWAYGDDSHWFWPSIEPPNFWPQTVPLEENLESFILLFQGIGYQECDSDGIEDGYEKVAIFCDFDGIPSHAARQLEDGLWTSKLGPYVDISHNLSDLEGDVYGAIRLYMKRKKKKFWSKKNIYIFSIDIL